MEIFENQLAFCGVTGKNKVAPFFPDTVYIYYVYDYVFTGLTNNYM